MITTDFLSTVSWKQAVNSLVSLTIKSPWLKSGKQNNLLIGELQDYFGGGVQVSIFYNARTALYQYLKALKLEEGSEVILNGYNCVSVSNAVIQAGYIPKYIDIETDTFGIDFSLLEKSVSPKTKVIILQHSFGAASRDTLKILQYAKQKGIIVVEDVAHSLGTELDSKKLGTLGDAAIFSTGRDKVISSVNGAFLLENTPSKNIDDTLGYPPLILTIRNHFYNIFGYTAKKTYGIKLGKVIMLLSRKMKLFPDIVSKREFDSNERSLNFLLPNSLAYLIRGEIQNLDKYYKLRNKYSNIYHKHTKIHSINTSGNGFRTVHLCKSIDERSDLISYMKHNGVLLGITWTGKNIIPLKVNLAKAGYKLGSCPIAEDISKRLVFLPNGYNLDETQIEKVAQLLNNFYKKDV